MSHLAIFAIFAILLVGTASALPVYPTITPGYNYAQPTAPGFVQFHILANPAQDYTVWVINDMQNITSFDARFDPDGSTIVGQNSNMSRIEIPADGVWSDEWQAGNYTAYLQNGNGNQLETIRFRIGAGWPTYVNFIGAAYTMEGKRGEQVQPTVTPTPTGTPLIPPTQPTVVPTLTPNATPTVTQIPTTLPTVEPTVSPTPTPYPTVTTTPTITASPTPTITVVPTTKPTPTITQKPPKCKPHKHEWWHVWDFETECAPEC